MKTKKSLLIAPALGVLLLAAAGSVSGTVAWFSAVRVFDTEIANFSVVEIDGNLDVKMKAGEGTINVRDDRIAVINDANKPTSQGSFTKGAEDEKPDAPSNGDLFYDETHNKMLKFNSSGSTWDDFNLTKGDYYNAGDVWYVATSTTAIETANSNRPVVLTHGSFDIDTGYASTLDPDASVASPSYLGKGVDGAGNNWIYKNNVSINQVKANPSDPDVPVNVDVYVAVSWEMTFKYNFASDTTAVAIYLDSQTSNFEAVTDPSPDYRFNPSADLKTEKGFRIGFYGADYADDVANTAHPGDAYSGRHNFVWGNHTLIKDFDADSTYAVGDCVKNTNYYVCNTAIGSAHAWNVSEWTEVSDYASQTYALNDYVLHEGAVYKCTTAITSAHAWDAKEWTATGDIVDAQYIKYTAPSTLAPQNHTGLNYTAQTDLDRVDALEEAANTVVRPERLCVLTKENPAITVKCAAWYEGTDPNVVSGAAMACLKANMHFYSRTVTGALS